MREEEKEHRTEVTSSEKKFILERTFKLRKGTVQLKIVCFKWFC